MSWGRVALAVLYINILAFLAWLFELPRPFDHILWVAYGWIGASIARWGTSETKKVTTLTSGPISGKE